MSKLDELIGCRCTVKFLKLLKGSHYVRDGFRYEFIIIGIENRNLIISAIANHDQQWIVSKKDLIIS